MEIRVFADAEEVSNFDRMSKRPSRPHIICDGYNSCNCSLSVGHVAILRKGRFLQPAPIRFVDVARLFGCLVLWVRYDTLEVKSGGSRTAPIELL